MPINKTIKIIFLAAAIFFQFYLAYASTLYLAWGSPAFILVVLTALVSAITIIYYICVVFERENVQ